MISESIIWKGQRQEKLEKAKKLELSISGLRDSIRAELNPHEPVLEINQELVAELAFELSSKVIEYKKLQKEINAINKSLGIE